MKTHRFKRALTDQSLIGISEKGVASDTSHPNISSVHHHNEELNLRNFTDGQGWTWTLQAARAASPQPLRSSKTRKALEVLVWKHRKSLEVLRARAVCVRTWAEEKQQEQSWDGEQPHVPLPDTLRSNMRDECLPRLRRRERGRRAAAAHGEPDDDDDTSCDASPLSYPPLTHASAHKGRCTTCLCSTWSEGLCFYNDGEHLRTASQQQKQQQKHQRIVIILYYTVSDTSNKVLYSKKQIIG